MPTRGPGPHARTGDETDAPVRATYRVLEALAAPGDITYGGTWTIAATHVLATPPTLAGEADPPLVTLTVGGTVVPWAKLRFGSLPGGAAAPFPPAPDEAVLDISRGHVELGATWPAPGRCARPGTGRFRAASARSRVTPRSTPRRASS